MQRTANPDLISYTVYFEKKGTTAGCGVQRIKWPVPKWYELITFRYLIGCIDIEAIDVFSPEVRHCRLAWVEID